MTDEEKEVVEEIKRIIQKLESLKPLVWPVTNPINQAIQQLRYYAIIEEQHND